MQILHACCVALKGVGILITGASQAGKTSLAIELLTRGAQLVADDQVCLSSLQGVLVASAPPPLAGYLEMAGIGIIDLSSLLPDLMYSEASVPIAFEVHLSETPPDRLPDTPASMCYESQQVLQFPLWIEDRTAAAKAMLLAQVFQQEVPLTTVSFAKPRKEG